MLRTTIAHYKITAKLGQGGMGEVYRATDTKLDREVAIKVLPESFAQDKERLARFEREAKTLAALSHTNIASIHGLEQSGRNQALVLELVDGEDLSTILKRGPLPVDEALEICKQIAEALEAAHEKGIIHRDLKPSNIKVTAEGKVKVLDFGLAKVLCDESDSSAASTAEDSPTITDAFTKPGTILGTAAYMSPEQARGKHIDKRSDNWAFGCVLFECLSGKRTFQGEDVTDTLASIIKGEPDWSALPTHTPPAIQLLLRKCLAKDRRRRLRDIGDALVDLEGAIHDPESSFIRLQEGALGDDSTHSGISKSYVTALVAFVTLVVAAVTWFLKPADPSVLSKKTITPRHVTQLLQGEPDGRWNSRNLEFDISPNGQKLAYVKREDQTFTLHLLDLTTGVDEELQMTRNAHRVRKPFFHFDSKSIGYFSFEKNTIFTMSLETGRPIDQFTSPFMPGASWLSEDQIIFSGGRRHQILRMFTLSTGERIRLTEIKEGETYHRWPQCLPDGEHVLFMCQKESDSGVSTDVEIIHLKTKKRIILKQNCHYARFAAPDLLWFVQDAGLYAAELDLEVFKLKGESRLIVPEVVMHQAGSASFAVANDGTLVYTTGASQLEESKKKLMWVDLQGGQDPVEASSVEGVFSNLALSPDGQTVALQTEDNIQLLDISRNEGKLTPISIENYANSSPVWIPGTQSIIFYSERDGQNGIWRKKGLFQAEELLFEAEGVNMVPTSASADGRWLFGAVFNEGTGRDIWVLDLEQANSEPKIIVDGNRNDTSPALSPNGDWLVYRVYDRILLKPFGKPGVPTELFVDRTGPLKWSADGDRLYFEKSNIIQMIDMNITKNVPKPGLPMEVVHLPSDHQYSSRWDLDSENQRALFLVDIEENPELAPDEDSPPTVNIIFNAQRYLD